ARRAAPGARGRSSRAGRTSTAMIVTVPAARAAITALRPTAPAPITAKVEPTPTFSARRTVPAPVWMPQPSGPRSSSGVGAQLDGVAFVGDGVGGEGRLAEEPVVADAAAVAVGGPLGVGAVQASACEVDGVEVGAARRGSVETQ